MKWVGAAIIILVAFGTWWVATRRPGEDDATVIPGDTRPAITVEVLNGTRVDGLARRVTSRLRRAGVDVVYFGSASLDTAARTLILVRRGDTAVAEPVRRVLGVGVVQAAPDATRLLDVSVILGADAAARDLDP